MPVSLASLPGAVKKAGERGIRDGIRKELTRPTVTFGISAGAVSESKRGSRRLRSCRTRRRSSPVSSG